MENLYELLEEAAHKVPTKGIVIVNNSQCDLFLTYSELREKSRKIAFILKSYYQVKPVSKIIISVEKSENFILLFWGCVMAGCIPVLMPSVQFSNKNSIAFERLKNAIDISQYKYDEDIRIAYRKKYGVEDKFVIGNVGRLQFQKNQLFLLDIFASVLKKRPEAILWMIGQGEDEEKIREKIQKLNLGTAVKMLGVRNDVPNLLQAMDVFVFPSVFEGLGIALLEAQATGLTCIASKDVIPVEVKVTPQLQFVSLKESAEVWADRILNAEYCEKRDTLFQLAMKAGYDINTEVGRLETLLGEKR